MAGANVIASAAIRVLMVTGQLSPATTAFVRGTRHSRRSGRRHSATTSSVGSESLHAGSEVC
jgi:hypothetical protein